MRILLSWMTMIALGLTYSSSAQAQATAVASHRTLTGKIIEADAGQARFTVELHGATKAKSANQTWILAVGKQTLLLRAGRNGQFSSIEVADLKKGDEVQAVVALQADPTDKTHDAWWLVVYPSGTTPPSH